MLSYESKFSRHMRNMGNAAEYLMFFKWKSKILVCLCIFYKKNLGSKVRALFFLLIILIYVEKKIRSLRLTEIPWSFSGKLLWFQQNCTAPRGLLGLIFARYVPLASQSPFNPIMVYSVAVDPILVTFEEICNFCDPNLVTFFYVSTLSIL